MGLGGSKDNSEFVFDKDKISFDEFGNLRYEGRKGKSIDREAECREIMEADNFDDKVDGQIWYIVDAVWVEAWLHYIHVSQDAPRPGPCSNLRLIVWNEEEKKWKGKKGLAMATQSRGGDYRRVTEAMWKALLKHYPNSGPPITTTYSYDQTLASTGYYTTDGWSVVDYPPPKVAEKKHFLPFKSMNAKLSRVGSKKNNLGSDNSGNNSGMKEVDNSQPDSDDDEPSALLAAGESSGSGSGNGDPVVSGNSNENSSNSSKSAALLRGSSSRNFLGSKATNEAKEPKKSSGGSGTPDSQRLMSEDEHIPRDSYYANVFFGPDSKQ